MSDNNIISPYEIDILCQDKKIGIEYDGLYWHSEKFRDKNYHEKKRKLAAEKGITLFRIFEDEWLNKRSIIESFLKYKLSSSKEIIGARKCQIVELDVNQRKKFFNETHIDGDVKATVCFGLEYNNIIIAALSLRRPVHKKWNSRFELARFAVANNISCPGSLSRLTKAAIRYAKENNKIGLLTYVDTRHGTGQGYIKSGWTQINEIGVRFWWTDSKKRFDRFKFRADPVRVLTQEQIAKENNVSRIWGCSNLVFTID